MIAALLLATALLTNARVNDPAQTPAGQPDITSAVGVVGMRSRLTNGEGGRLRV